MPNRKVHCTSAAIAGGNRTTSGCPIARAIADHIPADYFVRVWPTSVCSAEVVFLRKDTFHDVGVRLPRSAVRFINRFDRKRPVKPFTFLLSFPAEVLPKEALP